MGAVVLLLGWACARPPVSVWPTGSPRPAGVALIEWQFPTSPAAPLPVDPAQTAWLADPSRAALWPALSPTLSEAHATDPEWSRERLERHGAQVNAAYVAGRAEVPPAYLLNVSAATPASLDAVVGEGVSIVSMCAAQTARWTTSPSTTLRTSGSCSVVG